MTQKSVFLEGVFTLRNLRSMGTAAIIEILLASGIAGILIWQQVRPVSEVPPVVKPIVDLPQQTPPLQHSTPVMQQPQSEPLYQVPSVPARIPSQASEPLQPPSMPAQPIQPPQDLAAEFSTMMLRAINDQKVYPKVALLKGDTGEAVVSFDYIDGVVSNIHVDQSSGSRELDQAAVQAVQKAVLPPKPAELAGLRHFVFRLAFHLGG